MPGSPLPDHCEFAPRGVPLWADTAIRSDASLRHCEPQDRWSVIAHRQNIANNTVRSSAARFALPDGSIICIPQYLPPRTYGVILNVWF